MHVLCGLVQFQHGLHLSLERRLGVLHRTEFGPDGFLLSSQLAVNDPSTTPNPPLPVTLDLCVEDGVDRSVGQILTHLLGLLVHREVIGAHLDPSSYFLKASLSSRHMASSPVSGLSGCNTRVIARYTDLARSHPTVANSVLAQYAVAVRLF